MTKRPDQRPPWPQRRGPEMLPGFTRMAMVRHGHEGGDEAVARARLKPWWPRVVEETPVPSGGKWVWTLRPEAATGRTG